MVAILLLGFLLRCALLVRNRAMGDEALYGYWGLQIATGADPMLDREPVDKPPLFPYTLALTFILFRPAHSQAAGPDLSPVGGALACAAPACRTETRQIELESRLPGLFAGTAAIALLYSLGKRLFGDVSTALIAAILLALSPFATLFSPTAFVDPMLTTWVLGALLAAGAGRLGLAGLLAGLAAATKQQGLLFVPLIVAIGLLAPPKAALPGTTATDRLRRPRRHLRFALPWLLFLVGLSVTFGSAIAWDQARAQRPGFFGQSIVSYGGLALAPLAEIEHRAVSWIRLMGSFWVSRWLNALFILALLASAAVSGVAALRRRRPPAPAAQCAAHGPEGDNRLTFNAILLFIILFLLAHWLLQIQLWDRYLLVILPLVALVLARALISFEQLLPAGRWRAIYLPGLAVLLSAGLAVPLVAALQDRVPIGGDHGAYDGIDALAAYAREHMPPGAVLYDHWLGYHYRFYLYGAPLHIHWYPDLLDLAQDAVAYRREPRYIAFPGWQQDSPAVAALAGAGIELAQVYETRRRDGSISFSLYRLVGP